MTKAFFGLFQDLNKYFGLYEFLRISALKSLGKTINIKSVSEFWSRVLQKSFYADHTYDSLVDGTTLVFKDFYLTDWVPKLPGNVWMKNSRVTLKEDQPSEGIIHINDKLYTIFDPEKKEQRIRAGLGTVRANLLSEDTSNFAILNLVSEHDWACDYGIPVIVSKAVYEEFQKNRIQGACWVKELRGIFVRDKRNHIKRYIKEAISAIAPVPSDLSENLVLMPHLPICYVYLSSPLNIQLATNNTHPPITAWTIFETHNSDYKYTYCQFNPNKEENFYEGADFLNHYAAQHDGKRIITDFDGVIPRLHAHIPIKTNPRLDPEKIESTHKGVIQWYFREKKQANGN